MPNEYSIEIHDFLSDKLKELECEQSTQKDLEKASTAGKIDEIKWVRQYLKENIDLKNYTYY